MMLPHTCVLGEPVESWGYTQAAVVDYGMRRSVVVT